MLRKKQIIMKNILVIGGTGMLGQPVSNELIKNGFIVTIFSTNEAEAKKKFPTAKIVFGDLKNVASIEKACIGQDAIYMNLSIPLNAKSSDWNPEKDGVKNVLSAAKKAGIKQIGYLSPLVRNYSENGKTWWYLKQKSNAVEEIKNSGISYFIFTASNFMENFLASMRRGNNINNVGTPKISNYYIAGSDFGKQVAKAFSSEPQSKEYFIQGPQVLNPKEAVKLFTENYSKESLKPGSAPMGILKFVGCFNNQIANDHASFHRSSPASRRQRPAADHSRSRSEARGQVAW